MSLNLEIGQDPSLDEVFFESYNYDSGDSDDSDNDDHEKDVLSGEETNSGYEDDVEELANHGPGEEIGRKLCITEAQARENYLTAGTEVAEEEDRITVAAHYDLINPEVDVILEKIVVDLNLPYKLSDFQRIAVNTACDLKNLILVSPTGIYEQYGTVLYWNLIPT